MILLKLIDCFFLIANPLLFSFLLRLILFVCEEEVAVS
jgi:hypothetical protein